MIYLLLTWLLAPLLWLRAALRGAQRTNRILVIQTAKIGDFVATTPVFRALRNRLPGTEIVALLHPVNLPLARQLESIDRIVTLRDGRVFIRTLEGPRPVDVLLRRVDGAQPMEDCFEAILKALGETK